MHELAEAQRLGQGPETPSIRLRHELPKRRSSQTPTLGARSGPAIVLVKPLRVFIAESHERVPGRARLHEFARDVELDVAVEPIDPLDGERRDQHTLSKPPIAGVDDEITNAPVRVVEH